MLTCTKCVWFPGQRVSEFRGQVEARELGHLCRVYGCKCLYLQGWGRVWGSQRCNANHDFLFVTLRFRQLLPPTWQCYVAPASQVSTKKSQ